MRFHGARALVVDLNLPNPAPPFTQVEKTRDKLMEGMEDQPAAIRLRNLFFVGFPLFLVRTLYAEAGSRSLLKGCMSR